MKPNNNRNIKSSSSDFGNGDDVDNHGHNGDLIKALTENLIAELNAAVRSQHGLDGDLLIALLEDYIAKLSAASSRSILTNHRLHMIRSNTNTSTYNSSNNNNNNLDRLDSLDQTSSRLFLPYSVPNSTTPLVQSTRVNNAAAMAQTPPFLPSTSTTTTSFGDHYDSTSPFYMSTPQSPRYNYYEPNYNPVGYSESHLNISSPFRNLNLDPLPYHHNRHQSDLYYQRLMASNGVWRGSSSSGSCSGTNYYSVRYTSFEQVRGRVCAVAKETAGCKFLKSRLEIGNPEELRVIFSEAKENLCSLMVHRVGSDFARNLIEVLNQDRLSEVLVHLNDDVRRLEQVCSDDIGTRVMQVLVMRLRMREQQTLLISVMSRIALTLTKNNNCNSVIKQCLKYFHAQTVESLLVEVAKNCFEIATDKCGCCVLQDCILKAKECILLDNAKAFNALVDKIIENAHLLSEHCYGNYVVQYIILLNMPHINDGIMTQLKGKFVNLSLSREGSNVVQKLLEKTGEENANKLTNEILDSSRSLEVLQDPFGNFVAQSALEASTGSVRNALDQLIERFCEQLQSHPYGERVIRKKSSLNKHKRQPACCSNHAWA
ncbi:Coatomer beta subunit [Trema orientale]|uniref:Coatomer beta subunit n=1 Tax=Trema orientale TaxID=63057 RepID=A0A2P5EYJ6_TREOI|nr:Coatomer beta subunit [Trema orientale]